MLHLRVIAQDARWFYIFWSDLTRFIRLYCSFYCTSCYSTPTFQRLISALGFVAGVTRLLCCLAALLFTEAYSLFMDARSLLLLHGYILFSVLLQQSTWNHTQVLLMLLLEWHLSFFPNKNAIISLNANSAGEPTEHRSDRAGRVRLRDSTFNISWSVTEQRE